MDHSVWFYIVGGILGIVILYALYVLAYLAAVIYAARKVATTLKDTDFTGLFNDVEFRGAVRA